MLDVKIILFVVLKTLKSFLEKHFGATDNSRPPIALGEPHVQSNLSNVTTEWTEQKCSHWAAGLIRQLKLCQMGHKWS